MHFPPDTLRRLHRIFFPESTPPAEWYEHLSVLQQEHDADDVELIAQFHAVYLHQHGLSNDTSSVTDAVHTSLSRLEHFKSNVTLLIQATDSERWLRHVLDFYDDIGVKVVFSLNERTSGAVRTLLSSKGAVWIDTSGERRVDDLIDHIFAGIRSNWILRIDDTELPTPALLNFADRAVEHSAAFIWGFPRVHCRFDASRSELHYSQFLPFGPFARADLQWRLVPRPGGPKERRAATTDAVLLNFDWIARSFMERVDRLRLGSRDDGQPLTSLAPFYLQEAIPESWHMFSPLHHDRYRDFARRLYQSRTGHR